MAGYTRQSTFADGDTITAALFNNEYNQLVNAFSNTTGHSHDGTAASGPVIGLIGDAGETSPNNKVLIDTTNNYIEFYVEVSSAPVQQLYIADGAIIPVTDSDVDLGTSSLYFKDAYIDSITTTGNVSVGGNLTVTGTTTFNGGTLTLGDAADDNVVFGADVNSNIIPNTDNTYDLGSSSQEWKDLYVDGIAYLDGINFNGTTITATAAELNILDGVTSTAAELNILDGVTATTAELNLLDGVTSTTAELNILDGVTATATEINLLDGVTSTTAELNILDGVTATATEINLLDGVTATTAELNILDGVTSTATELNLLDGVTSTTAELNILDGVTSTTAELNLLDGVTATTAELNYVDVATAGTVEASKAIVVDSNKDFTGARNVTITGELDAATLDISGDADIDGTLEADAITIGGVTLAETISDTVGAMVSSNTETNITVTYDDTDNTLDFVIGTLNQDTTGNAATATALETARTIHGVSFDGTANIDLTEVVQDTVGAMFTSNTESGITVAYQDSDGTVDFTVGTLNQDTTGNAATATALATARTIGGVSFDGTANIVPTTFNAATFSGDLNVDSGVLFADVSTNRVGINQTTPDVSLDLGANTDAIHVPVGTTAQRPASPAAGYFRYNTTTGGFEGYTDAWGAIAGSGGGTAPSLDTMTGDGSDTTLTLSTAPVNENATFVTIDGVLQHKDTYSISGNTLTFSEAPPSGSKVESITLTTTTSTTANILSDADADTKVQVEESSDEDKIRFDTGGTERAVIDSSGLKITSGYISLNNSDDSRIAGDGDSIDFNLWDNSSAYQTRMTILDTGNVGIGTSSPSATLDVSSASQNVLDLETTNSDGPLLTFINNGTVRGYIGNAEGAMGLGTTNMAIRAQGELIIGTNGNNERMRIDSSGNVGIGTTSPAEKLEVNGVINIKRAGDHPAIRFTEDSTVRAYMGSGDWAINGLADDDFGISSSSTGDLAFGTGAGSERMRIDATGDVSIGTTSNGGKFYVASNEASEFVGNFSNSNGSGYGVAINTGSGNAVFFYHAGTNVGSISTNSSSTSYNTSSDARLKDVIGEARGLEVINELNPVSYNWKADGKADEGLIAQDVLDVVPNAVSQNEENQMYQMDYSKLVVHLVKGMKEQQTQIEALQSEINLLKGE